ncbi:hypothetical protein SNEBB_009684 [Seison nebaliae]|nr:hypothetical protein SNEBB_009684 [Seison nebaliae]
MQSLRQNHHHLNNFLLSNYYPLMSTMINLSFNLTSSDSGNQTISDESCYLPTDACYPTFCDLPLPISKGIYYQEADTIDVDAKQLKYLYNKISSKGRTSEKRPTKSALRPSIVPQRTSTMKSPTHDFQERRVSFNMKTSVRRLVDSELNENKFRRNIRSQSTMRLKSTPQIIEQPQFQSTKINEDLYENIENTFFIETLQDLKDDECEKEQHFKRNAHEPIRRRNSMKQSKNKCGRTSKVSKSVLNILKSALTVKQNRQRIIA